MYIQNKNSKVDICFLVSTADIGGAEAQLINYVLEINKLGVKSKVIFMSKGTGSLIDKYDIRSEEYRIIQNKRTGKNLFLNRLKIQIALIYFMIIYRPKIISTYLYEPLIFARGVLFILPRIKLVANIRGDMKDSRVIPNYLITRALKKSEIILVNSSYLLNSLVEKFNIDSDRIIVIANGIHIPKIAGANYESSKSIYLSNFIHYKGHSDFLSAYDRTNQTFEVYLKGEGTLKAKIISTILNNGNFENIEVISQSNTNESFFSKCGFAIHPSNQESRSNAILEEMSQGLAVVAFDIGGNSEIIENGVNGFLVPKGNYDLFFSYMNLLIKSTEIRKTMGLNARKSTVKYSWTLVAQEINERYLSILHNR